MAIASSGTRMYDSAELDAAFGGGSLAVEAPLTGAVVAFALRQSLLYIKPAATIAALTVRLPPEPIQGQLAAVSFGATVTALTLETADGVAVATVAGAIGAEISFRFIDGAWVAWNAPGAEIAVQPVAPPVNVDVPYASQTGDTLHCTMGNWEGEPSGYSYMWILDGATEAGGGADYKISADEVGHKAACTVTATNALGQTTAPPSNSVTIAAPVVRAAAALAAATKAR